jgi:hypothetical protein
MFCQRCGAQIPEDSTTCPRCGTPAIIISPLANIPAPDGSAAPPPPSEQFGPLPPWQPTVPMPGGVYPGGPLSVRPPSPPITQRFFGPPPQPGVPLVHRNRVQRWLLSRMRRSAASSVWLGAVIGALVAFALVLAFSIIFSLTLGHTLDQSFLNSLSTGQTGLIFSSDTNSAFLYSNPLFLMAYAHRTTIDLHLSLGASGISASASEGVTPPVSLLLLLPAIGLIFGGYLAASTNYNNRRLFSITRGASIGILYGLLLLIISLATSIRLSLSVQSVPGFSTNTTITPDGFSAFLSGLLCGIVFGAIGGMLQSRAIPPAPPARPASRGWTLIRGVLLSAVKALGIYFILCLILVIGLYVVAQLGGPALHTQGTPSPTSSSSTCQVFLQQPDPSTRSTLPNNFPTNLSAAISSPTLALWVMALSMGAPLQVSALGQNISLGLFNANCQPGSEGAVLYFLLLLPAACIFVGGWMAARAVQPRSTQEAIGAGLLMAPAIAILSLVASLLASFSESLSVSGFGVGATITLGPAIGWLLLASLLFGGVFGVLGNLVGRPRHLPPLQPAAAPAWPNAPGAWPPGAQPPSQPIISPAVASIKPDPLTAPPGEPSSPPSDAPTSSAPPPETPPQGA